MIKIEITTPCDVGVGTSIHWKDGSGEEKYDKVWDKITKGIHALLMELDPIPEGGWNVVFMCPEPERLL